MGPVSFKNSQMLYFSVNSTEDEMKQQETASLTSNPQPDVLSGLENVTISQHLENTDNNKNGGDISPSMSKSSSSEFESIYDKYRDKSDDELQTQQADVDNVAFQPVQISNEELEDMLQNLEDENQIQEACSSQEVTLETDAAGKNSTENLGARPKQFPNAHSEKFCLLFVLLHIIYDTTTYFYILKLFFLLSIEKQMVGTYLGLCF